MIIQELKFLLEGGANDRRAYIEEAKAHMEPEKINELNEGADNNDKLASEIGGFIDSIR